MQGWAHSSLAKPKAGIGFTRCNIGLFMWVFYLITTVFMVSIDQTCFKANLETKGLSTPIDIRTNQEKAIFCKYLNNP